ncbi:MAG: hypothetical protein ABFD64_04915 [Armatimonadota bacterium]
MRRILAVLLAVLASPAIAHGDHCEECLEHHWMKPEYLSETRLQLIFIAGIMSIYIVYQLILWFKRTRRCG